MSLNKPKHLFLSLSRNTHCNIWYNSCNWPRKPEWTRTVRTLYNDIIEANDIIGADRSTLGERRHNKGETIVQTCTTTSLTWSSSYVVISRRNGDGTFTSEITVRLQILSYRSYDSLTLISLFFKSDVGWQMDLSLHLQDQLSSF